ncbi:MAG TPA: hypothetical protein VIW24_03980 [Aldersonia sp.]
MRLSPPPHPTALATQARTVPQLAAGRYTRERTLDLVGELIA